MPCYCMPLSTGALIIGLLEIIGHMCVVTLASAKVNGKEAVLDHLSLDDASKLSLENEVVVRWTLIMIISSLGLLFAFALVIGVQMNSQTLLMMWLVSKVVLLLAFVLQWAFLPGERRYQTNPTKKDISRARTSNFVQLISQMIGMYMWYVVFSYWKQLKKLNSVGASDSEFPSPNNSNC